VSGNDTTNFDNDTSGNHGVPFDTSPDLSGDQGRVRRPHPEDTMQDSTRSRGFQPQAHASDATQKDIPDETQQEFHSLGDAETQLDYSADRTEQDIRIQKTADHSGQKTDQDIGADQKKVWADPFAQEDTSDEGCLGFNRQNPAFDKTAKSGGADLADTSGDTNWDALDKPRAGSSGFPSQSASKTPQSNPKKSPVGQTFANKYEIVGQIGQGGMGIVYKANDMILARTVAIKVIKANSQAKVEEISRFQLEAKSIAKLDHPNIIRVYEMNVTMDGDPYFVLEYIAGNSLSNEIRGRKGLPLDETIAIVEQVCDALNHAHESGVIHRDLKPSNIMLVKLRDRVVVKLLDFGIAKHFAVDDATLQLLQLTRPGQAFGSPHYMSPEQSRGQADSPASDIYSLGCMFFEMITGHPPFSGDNVLTTMNMHQTEEIPSVGDKVDEKFRDDIDSIIARMMAKRLEDRYLSVMDAKGDLLELRRKMKPPEIDPRAESPTLSPVGEPVAVEKGGGKARTPLVAIAVGIAIFGIAAMFYGGVTGGAWKSTVSEVDSTPWSAYDYKGQKMLDSGNYKVAAEFFEKSFKKALTLHEPQKAVLANRSLREMRMVSFLLNDQEAVNLTNRQLLDYPEKSVSSDSSSFENISRKFDIALGHHSSSKVQECLDELHREFPRLRRSGIDLRGRLAEFKDKLEKTAGMDASRAYVQLLLTSVRPSSESENSPVLNSTISELISMADLTALEACLAGDVGLRTGCPDQTVRQLLEYADAHGTAETRRKTQLLLSQLYWRSGIRPAAVKVLENELDRLERRKDVRFSWLFPVLVNLAWMYHSQAESERALPLLKRARAIALCESDFGVDGFSNMDTVNYNLVNVHSSLKQFSEALQILRSIEDSSLADGPRSEQRVRWLAHFGHLQVLSGETDKSTKPLTEALDILSRQAKPSPEGERLLKQIESDLARVN